MILAEIKQTLERVITPVLERHNAFLVELTLNNERRGTVVQAFVDTDEGIRIEECAEISRELGLVLEAESVFERSYRLEVSSPGIDKPLRLLRQYPKNIGRRFSVQYRGKGVSETLTGILEGVVEEVITFTPEQGAPIRLQFSQIIETKELLPW
jgi:ribosome maturation factor RimP